jgi:hypothetical protein
VKKHDYEDAFTSFSALLDKGAEVFTKKKFKHSQSKTWTRQDDMEQSPRRAKPFTIKSKFHRDEFDLG